MSLSTNDSECCLCQTIHDSYIDKGQNPELFTRHQLEQTLADHQAVQKKVEAYKVRVVLNFCKGWSLDVPLPEPGVSWAAYPSSTEGISF